MSAVRHSISAVILIIISATVTADERLPRVLIIGDRIYQQPAGETAKELKGQAEVVFARLEPGEIRSSETLLADLDRLLGDVTWDLIHFNVGLGDLVHRAPGMKSFRVMARQVGGIRSTPPKRYEQNLKTIAARLKATRARIIWASTTPIRHSSTNVFEPGSEVSYNAVAERVMAEHNIPVNDMYGSVRALIDMQRPASHGADPFFFDRKPIHDPIVKVIQSELSLGQE